MKKIISLAIAALLIIGIVGVGTFAYFSDTETSTDNIFTAGTLDLKTNDLDGVSGTLYADSMSPDGTVNSSALTLKNVGTTDGAALDIAFSYTESDGSPNTVGNADAVAAVLQVTTLTYGVTDLLATLTNTNGSAYIDVQDLTDATNVTKLTGLSGLNAGSSKNFAISVQLMSGTGFQADGITMTMTFTLRATSGYFSDEESSTGNILRVEGAPVYDFVVLAGSAVTNTGATTVTGDLGLSPGAADAVTGFPPGTVSGTIHAADAAAAQAQSDLTAAYNDAAGRLPVITVATELGGTTQAPGVYDSASGTFGITGTLTLDGDANAVWVFKMATTLITADNSRVSLSGGAKAANVYWQVGSSATLGAGSTFKGNILALTSATLNTDTNVEGRVLARNGAVTLHTSTITKPAP